MTQEIPETSQSRFDEKYITCYEIQEKLKVNRSNVLYARRRGMLPDPVRVLGVGCFIWERKAVTPFLNAWKISLSCKKGRQG